MKLLSDDGGLLFSKPVKKKKRRKHRKSILKTEKNTCFLCSNLYGDWSRKSTEEHHILYGSGLRVDSEKEGLKVNLCRKHHRGGPEAVHDNREMRELLCKMAQIEYEKTHTREEWMQISKKNYLPKERMGADEKRMRLTAGDYVRYMQCDETEKEGYIIEIIGFCDVNTAWIGKEPGTVDQEIEFVQIENIVEKVPPPSGVKIQRDVTNP